MSPIAVAAFLGFELFATKGGLAALALIALVGAGVLAGRVTAVRRRRMESAGERLIRRVGSQPATCVVVRHLGQSEERHYAW